jgi:putative membrane protein
MPHETIKEDLTLRDCLALERTTLANERTFLSYARTAVMVFITGITIFKIFPEIQMIFIIGWGAALISVILFFAGLKKYLRRFRSLALIESKCSTSKAE